MNAAEFRCLLESCTTLSDKQRAVLQSTLNKPFRQRSCLLYERLGDNFAVNPVCQHCNSDNVRKYGFQNHRQRYQCKTCGRTFNALTGTPLAHVNVTSVLDQYLECMTTSMTLRAVARACGISLDTAFHLQYVNAHHSTLKGWINSCFKGVASKYLNRYVGWRRALSTCELTLSRLIEKLAGGWLYQLEL